MITLPTEPLPATTDITAFNMLLMGDPGIGKSSFLASIPNYLLVDPINGMKGLPGLKVQLQSWNDHLDLPEKLSKIPRGAYAGIGLDLLNISYDICSAYITKILKVNHPSELAHGTGWTRVTTEFTKWLQSMTLLGYHIVGTCHTTIMEVRLNTRQYNRWIPAFVGGSAQSAYANTLKLFDIKGFMCTEMIAAPPVRQATTKEGGIKSTVDTRVDMSDLQFTENRVIHFTPSNNWLAGDTSQMLPNKVVLGTDWREDWNMILKAWGSEGKGMTVLDESVETTGQQVETAQIKASGLAAGVGK